MALVAPTDVGPLRCCYVSREMHVSGNSSGVMRSRRLYGARSIGGSELASQSARSSATHDVVILPFPRCS